ncbi:carbohydrate ABC transporter permease [Streptomyces sp. NRRL F-5123]|uniref:carbohydrate ABC transporter permease n=1 Tax=Streptomyces sp. NRRL F-5123 TaxID=1463856 RepID=UPI000693D168|nr:sugar ABC transporter permease [Streptomyces sp. NRRL F-5123]
MRPAPRARRARLQAAVPYLFLLPALLLELLVHVVPMAAGIGMSLLRLTQFHIRDWTTAPFVDLAHYRLALDFHGPVGAALLRSLGRTLLYTLVVVAGSWCVGFAAAVLAHDARRGRGAIRALFLVPYALPVYAAVITWSFMLQRDTGAVNAVLVDGLHLTGSRPFWLIGDHAFWSVSAVAIWRTWPFVFLVVTAGLQPVPRELYEAAALDGAGMLQQIRSVTLPWLAPVNGVLLVVLALWTFNDFTTPFTLFGAAPPRSADLLPVHIYQASFITFNFGLGSAMSVLVMLFLAAVAALGALALLAARHVRGARRPQAGRGQPS